MVYKLIIKRIPFNIKLDGSDIDLPFQFDPQIFSRALDHYSENDVILKPLNFEWLKRLVLHIPSVEKYYQKALRIIVEELGVAEVELYKEIEIPDEEINTFINELKSIAGDIGVELEHVK